MWGYGGSQRLCGYGGMQRLWGYVGSQRLWGYGGGVYYLSRSNAGEGRRVVCGGRCVGNRGR